MVRYNNPCNKGTDGKCIIPPKPSLLEKVMKTFGLRTTQLLIIFVTLPILVMSLVVSPIAWLFFPVEHFFSVSISICEASLFSYESVKEEIEDLW